MFDKVTKKFPYGAHTVTLETGEIARQSGGAVVCSMDDTVVLATVVARKEAKPGQDFFPLTVDYVEKTYAAGRIPGGFFKREGRPSEKETLTSRLIDRPIRPLFPDGFFNEVQVVIHVLSIDPEIDPDIPAMIGASAALVVVGHPVQGTDRRGTRRLHGRPIRAEPDRHAAEELEAQPCCCRDRARGADGRVRGRRSCPRKSCSAPSCTATSRCRRRSMRSTNWCVTRASRRGSGRPPPKNETLIAKRACCSPGPNCAMPTRSRNKQARTQQDQRRSTRECGQGSRKTQRPRRQPKPDDNAVDAILFDLQAKIVRSQILDGEPRIDGRDTRTVRPIEIRTRRAAAHARLGAVHARRDAGAGDRDARHQAGRADHRRAAGRISRALHAPLQHAAVRDRRDRARRRAEAPRDRSRPARQAGAARGACRARGFPVLDAASFPRSPSPTARRRWHRYAAAAWR